MSRRAVTGPIASSRVVDEGGTLVETTDSFSTVLSAASVDDTLILETGQHLTPSGGTSRQSVNKRVVIKAQGYNASWEGRWVSSADGHEISDWPVEWRGGWSFTSAEIQILGILFNGRMTTGPGSVDLRADSLIFRNCGFTDEFFGYIMVHVENLPSDIQFYNCRFWNIGARSSHDHPIYWKQITQAIGRCRVYDSIFYNHTGWAMHAYPNGDGVLYKRCLVYRGNAAGVFSAEGADSTSGAGFEDCLLVDAGGTRIGTYATQHPSYLVERSGAGSGYIQDTMAVNNDPGPDIMGVIESHANVTQTNVVTTGVPVWLNGPPETTGDFRLDPDPSNPALGYGPSYIQP